MTPLLIDTTVPPGARSGEAVPRGHTAFAYVDLGEGRLGAQQKPAHAPALVVVGDGDPVEASAGLGAGSSCSSLPGRCASRSPAATPLV